jgi:hypothetical protein
MNGESCTLKVFVVLNATLLTLACAPAAKAPAAKDPSEVPSLQAVCDHVASLEWRGTSLTKEQMQRTCEDTNAGYRDEGEAARWSCRSSCYMAAQTKDDVGQCESRCAVPQPNVSCVDVFRETEMSAALGVPVETDGALGALRDRGICGGQFSATSKDLVVVALLSWHPTLSQARRSEKLIENAPSRGKEECRELVGQGRFTLTLRLYRGQTCDHEGFKRALESARRHLTSTGAHEESAKQSP